MEVKTMQVKDAMHSRIITIEPHATLPEAVVKMQELKMKRLPVVHEGKLVGLLTDGEVKRNLPTLSEGLTPWEFAGRAGRVRVRDAMRTPVLTAGLIAAVEADLDRRVDGAERHRHHLACELIADREFHRAPSLSSYCRVVVLLPLTLSHRRAARTPLG